MPQGIRYFQNSRGQWMASDPYGNVTPIGNPYAMGDIGIPPAPAGNAPYGIPLQQSTPSAQPTPTPQTSIPISNLGNPANTSPSQEISNTGGFVYSPNVATWDYGNPNPSSNVAQPQYYPDMYNQDVFSQQYGFQGGVPSIFGGSSTPMGFSTPGSDTGSAFGQLDTGVPTFSQPTPIPQSPVGTTPPGADTGSSFGQMDNQGGAVLTGQPDIQGMGSTPQNDLSGLGVAPNLGNQSFVSNNYYDAGNGTTYVYDSNWNYMYTTGTPNVQTQTTDPNAPAAWSTTPVMNNSSSGALGSNQDPNTGLGLGPTFDTSGTGEGGSQGMFGGSSLDPSYVRKDGTVPFASRIPGMVPGHPGGGGGGAGGFATGAPKYF